MKLVIKEWKSAHKMLSMWIGTLAVAFGAAPEDMQIAILTALHVPQNRIAAVLGAMFMASRMLNQTATPKAEEPEESDEKGDK